MSDVRCLHAALPSAMREAWTRIGSCDELLSAAINSDSAEDFADLAEQRNREIVSFFERFALCPETAELRYALLEELMRRNERLVAETRRRLESVAEASAQARLARRAIGVYHEHEENAQSTRRV